MSVKRTLAMVFAALTFSSCASLSGTREDFERNHKEKQENAREALKQLGLKPLDAQVGFKTVFCRAVTPAGDTVHTSVRIDKETNRVSISYTKK